MSIRRHTAYNLVGAVLPVALSLATVPLYVHTVGEARYGILAIAWLLLGYFGLFDLGLGAAAGQRIAVLHEAPPEQRATVFWTALAMNGALGLLGGIVIWPVALYTAQHLTLDAALHRELVQSIPWLAVAVPVATLSGVLIGSLHGRRQFLELNIISIMSSGLAQILPLTVAIWRGPHLPDLIAAVLLARALAVGSMFWRCRVHVPARRIKVSSLEARSLLHFGGWVTVSSIVSPLMVVLDRFAIGSMMGPKAVAYYTVPVQITERSVLVPAALSSAMFPRMASATPEERQRLVPEAMRAVLSTITPLAVMGVLLIQPFISWWINPEFAAQAGPPAQLLVIAYWLNSCAQLPFSQLRATARPDVVAKCHLAELLPYMVMLYLGLHFGGLVGAAFAFLVRVGADCLLLMRFTALLRPTGAALLKQSLPLTGALLVGYATDFAQLLWWPGAFLVLAWSLAMSWSDAPEAVRGWLAQALHSST